MTCSPWCGSAMMDIQSSTRPELVPSADSCKKKRLTSYLRCYYEDLLDERGIWALLALLKVGNRSHFWGPKAGRAV